MNKTRLDLIGGPPITTDDWDFSQQATRDAFFGWLSGFGIGITEGFVISGCDVVVNGPNLDVSAGWLVIDGEIYEVFDHTIVDPLIGGDQTFWQVDISFDISGQKTFFDLSTQDMYEVRTASLTSSAAPPAQFFEFNRTTLTSATLDDKVREKILDRKNTYLKPQSWKYGSQTNNNTELVFLQEDGQNYEMVMNEPLTSFMKLVGEGNIVTLQGVLGTEVTTTFFEEISVPPAGFGKFEMAGLPSGFLLAPGETIKFEQKDSAWHFIGGSVLGRSLAFKKDDQNFLRQVFTPPDSNLVAATEKVIQSWTPAPLGTSLKPIFSLNIELNTGGAAAQFQVRLYVDGVLKVAKSHDMGGNESKIIHMIHSEAYGNADVVEWRIETAAGGSSYDDAIVISDIQDLVS